MTKIPPRPANAKPIILSRRVYIALREMALSVGGIGFGVEYENDTDSVWVQVQKELRGKPLSPYAIMVESFGGDKEAKQFALRTMVDAGLLSIDASNYAPRRIIEREKIPFGPNDPWPRFSFESWCEELQITMGEE